MSDEIRTPFLWTVQRPNGKRWMRSFKSENAAWHSLCGADYTHFKKQFYGNVANAKKLGYTVVEIGWTITYAS